MWKIAVFRDIAEEQLRKGEIQNIVALGDSAVEIEASQNLSTMLQHSFVKTIRFKTNPSPIELVQQLKLVFDNFDQIYSSTENQKIELENKNAPKQPPPLTQIDMMNPFETPND